MDNNTADDLKARVEIKRGEWHAKLAALETDTRDEASTTRGWIERHLQDLEAYLEHGWERISEETRAKVATWMKRA